MKTAIFMSFVAVNGQAEYMPTAPKDVPAPPVKGSDGQYEPAPDKATTTDPVDPVEKTQYPDPDPEPVYPTPVEPYKDAPVDPAPVDPKPVDPIYGEEPTPEYDDTDPDTDSDEEPPAPAPVYDAPSQHKCGTLYMDVLEHWFRYILSQIDPVIVDKIVAMLKELLDMVSKVDGKKLDPIAYAPVVAKVQELAGYCADHLEDDDVKGYVADACKKAQDTYNNIYDTQVDPDVYKAWDDLWTPCHNGNSTDPDPAYKEPLDDYYKAYSGYMEDGSEDPEYQQHIEKLCDSEDPAIAEPAKTVKYSVQQLSASDDGTAQAKAAAGKLVGSVLGMLSAALMAF